MSYLLSIIIPTKNRYLYLKECINTLSTLDHNKVEIVINDNSDNNNEFVSFLKSSNFKDNIKYYYTNDELSQTENSDMALNHATGEYCCYIGDDDSVSTKIIAVTEYLKSNFIKACVCDMSTYHWPDVVFSGKVKPSFSILKKKGKVKYLNTKKILKKFFSWGAQDIKFLPRIYHGIISKKVLDDVKNITGTYFPGPSPDMANAIACSLLIKKYIYVNAPLIISGYSFKSAGGLGLRGKHKGDLKNVKQLPKNAAEDWSPNIPKIWLGYTVWAESTEKALIKMGHSNMIKKINYVAMEVKIFLKYKEYRDIIKKRIRSFGHFCKFVYEYIRFGFRWLKDKIKYHCRRLLKNQITTYEKISLTDAFNKTNLINNKILEDIK